MKDGGPAFPVLHTIDGNWVKEPLAGYIGMSLRDYFAAAALQGIIANSGWEPMSRQEFIGESCANIAYKIADAMLAERDK